MHFPPPTHDARTAPARARAPRGFTLTELLVVIAIIAMLVAITSVAVMRAIDTAKQTRIKTELDQLDLAFKSYREKYGSYPPCNLAFDDMSVSMPERTARLNQIRAHVARVFPRYDLSNLQTDLQAFVDTNNFRPDQAIVFWLGGFNADPLRPFTDLNDFNLLPKNRRTAAFMDFDPTRLVVIPSTTDPWTGAADKVQCASYIPPGSKQQIPYVYFDATTFSDSTNYFYTPANPCSWDSLNSIGKAAGFAAVYVNDVDGSGSFANPPDDWANPESFQLISAGLDDKYGVAASVPAPRLYPAGLNYDTVDLADDDNVTNFCDSARLEDAKP